MTSTASSSSSTFNFDRKVQEEAEALVADLLADEDEDDEPNIDSSSNIGTREGLTEALTRAFASQGRGAVVPPGNDDDQAQERNAGLLSPERQPPASPTDDGDKSSTTEVEPQPSPALSDDADDLPQQRQQASPEVVSPPQPQDDRPPQNALSPAARQAARRRPQSRNAATMAEFERLMAANEPEPESESLPPSAQVRKRLQNFEAPEVDFSALPGFDEKKRKALTESLEGIKSITTEYKRIQDEMKALKESLYNQNGFQELAGTLQDMRGIRSLLEQNAEGESSNDINAAPGPGGDPDEQMMARMLDARLKQRKAARTDSTGSPDGAPTSGKDGGKDDQPPDLSAKLNTVIEMLKRKKPKPRKEGSSAGLSREDLMKAINEEICDVDEKKKNLEHVKTELSRNIGGVPADERGGTEPDRGIRVRAVSLLRGGVPQLARSAGSGEGVVGPWHQQVRGIVAAEFVCEDLRELPMIRSSAVARCANSTLTSLKLIQKL
eukprot:CAMPEP_0179005832 /NCGR_PEP_ID=MMETSP0795-20121207/14189_1 /TAXON_ID=88552 /ORGANISM="Amoebophrya sp., Strain Ameob2" /LENGTH=495 /DNA_ID=CAMNT_0020700469 /DNA_START=12 /DNA_END=1498 /DNA_ORIENTATION=-